MNNRNYIRMDFIRPPTSQQGVYGLLKRYLPRCTVFTKQAFLQRNNLSTRGGSQVRNEPSLERLASDGNLNPS